MLAELHQLLRNQEDVATIIYRCDKGGQKDMATIQFDWDEENTGHLARHGITPPEAEQVLFNWQIDLDSYVRNGEERIVQAGETDQGRVLVVVSTIRRGKTRIITAWPAKERIRRYFATQKRSRDAGRT